MSLRQTAPPRAAAPPRYKLALLSWVGAYTVITTILAAMGPLMAAWPLLLRTLLLSVLMVVAMTWFVIPSLTRLFRGWLQPSPRSGLSEVAEDRQDRIERLVDLPAVRIGLLR